MHMSTTARSKGLLEAVAVWYSSRAVRASGTAMGTMPQLASWFSRTRRLVALSSTTRTLRPARDSGSVAVSEDAGPTGRSSTNQKRLPTPISLSKPIAPPITSVSLRDIARPKPVPP